MTTTEPKTRPPLTDPQRAVLAFVAEHFRDHHKCPTLREVNARFGWASPQAALCHLRPLVRKGYLRRTPGPSRGYAVVDLDGPVGDAVAAFLAALGGE